ncbi:hypothetical protein [Clostridium beijerinckii]|jgi:hypothetical protein|uniref:hypothetical protein n=1 Tax=Clostridium beijerinckii TaxID=1520 RepID=UPI001494771C|nr:hypothetical protein [Clostridium beijerinckii]
MFWADKSDSISNLKKELNLERVKIPRCQNQLMLYRDEDMLTYTIFCEKCSFLINFRHKSS